MVKTRMQNGVAIKPPPISKAVEDDDYEIDDEYEPNSSDEGINKKSAYSGYLDAAQYSKERETERRSRKTNAKPKAKRQKAESSSKSKAANEGATTAKGGRRRKTLSLLPTMPLDVLFEV